MKLVRTGARGHIERADIVTGCRAEIRDRDVRLRNGIWRRRVTDPALVILGCIHSVDVVAVIRRDALELAANGELCPAHHMSRSNVVRSARIDIR